MDYKPGERFRLTTHVGHHEEGVARVTPHADATYEAFLNRRHPLFTGQVGVVEEVVPAGRNGAGPDNEDVVVLAFDSHDKDTGQKIDGLEGSRRVSFTEQQMQEWFERVEE